MVRGIRGARRARNAAEPQKKWEHLNRDARRILIELWESRQTFNDGSSTMTISPEMGQRIRDVLPRRTTKGGEK